MHGVSEVFRKRDRSSWDARLVDCRDVSKIEDGFPVNGGDVEVILKAVFEVWHDIGCIPITEEFPERVDINGGRF